MKLTIETIKKLIKEELQKESKYRKIIAPGPVHGKPKPLKGWLPGDPEDYEYTPEETGSTITYDDPRKQLNPDIRKALTGKGSSPEDHLQAYDFQRAMDPEFEKDVPPEEEEEAEKDFLDAMRKAQLGPYYPIIWQLEQELMDLQQAQLDREITLKDFEDKSREIEEQIYLLNLLQDKGGSPYEKKDFHLKVPRKNIRIDK